MGRAGHAVIGECAVETHHFYWRGGKALAETDVIALHGRPFVFRRNATRRFAGIVDTRLITQLELLNVFVQARKGEVFRHQRDTDIRGLGDDGRYAHVLRRTLVRVGDGVVVHLESRRAIIG